MQAASFETLDVKRAQQDLAKVHERVINGTGRVELTRDGCDERVVLISKAELEAMERALDILSDTDAVRAMRTTLARVVAMYSRCEAESDAADPVVSSHLTEIKTKLMQGASQ